MNEFNRRQLHGELFDRITDALNADMAQRTLMGDYPDIWTIGRAIVTLCVEILPAVSMSGYKLPSQVSITHLTCTPQLQGYGTTVINTITAFAQEHDMALVVPIPLPQSRGFWMRFPWDEVGTPDNPALRKLP